LAFLPITKQEMTERGWHYADFVVVTGDAYVDHPTFGTAIISRVLEAEGFKVAILAQPDWHSAESFKVFGRPRYGFMISSGNIDSMVAHYTAAKKLRHDDAYSPGRKAGKRPDRAVIVYSKLAKKAYPDVPVIIGGLEASLRRFAHYDYWDNCIKPSVLYESGADLLTFGMGENQTIEIAKRLKKGEKISSMTDIRGTCYLVDVADYQPQSARQCPSLDEVKKSKKDYAISCRIQQDEQDSIRGKAVIQRHSDKMLVQNPPMSPLTTEELDRVYELPYERYYHPSYEKEGGVPAIEEVEFSITHNRGCFGACAFCSIAFHQGRMITCRSKESILKEAEMLTRSPHFKGYIHDVGGPTANFRMTSCEHQLKNGMCKGKRCLAPTPCKQLKADHTEYLSILREIRAIPKIKKVFIRSGIRYDYLLEDKSSEFLDELVKYHVSGQLKVAPEHCSAAVLDKMGKPHIEAYLKFARKFYNTTEKVGKKQYLVPYLMSSHPGSTLNDAVELASFLKKEGIHPEQVQDFYPTPGTISTCMYYTGLDPYTLEEVYTPKKPEDKALQRALLQYYLPENKDKVIKAIKITGRYDLVGSGKQCLITKASMDAAQKNGKGKNQGKHTGNRNNKKQSRYKNKGGKH